MASTSYLALAGNLTPILTLRRMCCLGAPIALLWRFRELPEDPLGARFLENALINKSKGVIATKRGNG